MSSTPSTSPRPPASTDAVRLAAVLARDRAFDTSFVYGVTSTGIFCRPSCASRRPRPDRVRFFDGPDAAARAGFRPCLRCRPDAGADPVTRRLSDRMAKACAFIRAHADERLTLKTVAARVAMSPHHFQRTFAKLVGVSPREYANACRVRRFKTGLRRGASVTSALYEAGYGSSSRLYERANGSLGMTPATYRKGGAGAAIRYALAESTFGRLLVAATDRGIAAVKIGPRDAALEAALRAEFPAASIERDDRSLGDAVASVLARVEHPRGPNGGATSDIPLDVAATAFQWRVWQALQSIPAGSTRTYGDVARSIGRPSAARAVARACASNPVALVIPCHRVVPAGGGTGGYRWGRAVKEALLKAERPK